MSDSKDLQFNYIEHLQLDRLLSSQKFVSPHPEESLFVIMHQTYELWFKQVIHDFERVIVLVDRSELAQATWLLQRAARIFQTIDDQLGILEMMTAADFQEFRPYLKQSSGLQSRQFRKIEVLGGLRETEGAAFAKRVDEQWPGLCDEVPDTLHAAVLRCLDRQSIPLVDIYRRRWECFDLFGLCEAAIELDRRFLSWRFNHVKMVERMIGDKAIGTGGTSGSRYLSSTTGYRFFPEIWDIRNVLTTESGGKTSR